ncbi:MAG: hypothetical protein IIZ04_02425, partial [Aeriscardovia sp.]|nr:hypothetical protein [Aeriscardovia sp.]
MKKGQLVAKMAPVGKGQRYNITGLTHDESGFPTNSNAEAKKLMDRLMGKITQKYDKIVEVDQINMEDAEVAIFCYGGTYRAALTAMEELRKKGVKCGIFRPITIWPFPEEDFLKATKNVKKILVVEHNYGQILLEVQRLAKNLPVEFLGCINGKTISPDEIIAKVE